MKAHVTKVRVDQLLVERGLADSREKARALILAGDVAVIANVQSRTVVTAMNRQQMKDRIFTNIDSAVLV